MNYIPQKDFHDKVIGKGIDVDGRYGVQCVDLWNYFNKIVNNVYINCQPSGYAKSLFENRANNGVLKYFDVVDLKNIQKGDWCIWGNCKCSPKSHVAMFWEPKNDKYGQFLGQNQGGVKEANLSLVEYDGIIGVLRPKIYKEEKKTSSDSFFGKKGYFGPGDNHENIGKICQFMHDEFYKYGEWLGLDNEKILGNYYGPIIEAYIKEFQKRAKADGKYNSIIDGCVGPITLASLKEYGFKY